MNTIMRIFWHPKTFCGSQRQSDRRLWQGDWTDVRRSLNTIRICTSISFPRKSSTRKTWRAPLLAPRAGAYYIGCYLQKAMEAESMWGSVCGVQGGRLALLFVTLKRPFACSGRRAGLCTHDRDSSLNLHRTCGGTAGGTGVARNDT